MAELRPLSLRKAFLEQERVLSSKLTALLEDELAIWIIHAQEATVNVEQKAANRAAAELRLDAAQAMKNIFNNSKEALNASVLEIRQRYEELHTSGVDGIEPNVHGTAEVLNQWGNGQNLVSDQIDKAHSALVDAKKAVTQSLEAQQEALAREERCLAMVQSLKDHIQEVNHITGARVHRSIWRFPEVIWREIFAFVLDCET